ncbi:hypothetical protein PVAP13_6KG313412 [Panicum virgatum]|uniref:Uncharacterized protein n=1 Tax=Panicum virgatum TaxID=38727 RepID=A0A8T0RFB0_PANVG|nr:hypothetical protein PVAP13_6KG313412 [Panicum virgatum]
MPPSSSPFVTVRPDPPRRGRCLAMPPGHRRRAKLPAGHGCAAPPALLLIAPTGVVPCSTVPPAPGASMSSAAKIRRRCAGEQVGEEGRKHEEKERGRESCRRRARVRAGADPPPSSRHAQASAAAWPPRRRMPRRSGRSRGVGHPSPRLGGARACRLLYRRTRSRGKGRGEDLHRRRRCRRRRGPQPRHLPRTLLPVGCTPIRRLSAVDAPCVAAAASRAVGTHGHGGGMDTTSDLGRGRGPARASPRRARTALPCVRQGRHGRERGRGRRVRPPQVATPPPPQGSARALRGAPGPRRLRYSSMVRSAKGVRPRRNTSRSRSQRHREREQCRGGRQGARGEKKRKEKEKEENVRRMEMVFGDD